VDDHDLRGLARLLLSQPQLEREASEAEDEREVRADGLSDTFRESAAVFDGCMVLRAAQCARLSGPAQGERQGVVSQFDLEALAQPVR